ncbi:hypothetical protein CUW27_20720 [Salmonella enterica]|nr:hypothetical protein [Salmonella enterica]
MTIVFKLLGGLMIAFLIVAGLAGAADFPRDYFVFCFALVICRLIFSWRWASNPDALKFKPLAFIIGVYFVVQASIWALLWQEYGDRLTITPYIYAVTIGGHALHMLFWWLAASAWRRERKAAANTESAQDK